MNKLTISTRLITLIVAMQMFLGTIPYSPLQSTAWAESCSSGLVFNSILGRCLSSEQASQVAQAAQQCEALGTDAAKKQCYVDAAEGRLNDAVAKGDVSEAGKVKGGGISNILVLGGLAASIGFLASKGQCPGATSAYLIAGGSAAVLAGEILAKKTYKKKMKKAQEKLKEINDSSEGTTASGATSEIVDATNVQVEAFNALIMQEDAVISASKTKKKLYMLATAAYGAATVMAAMEMFKGPSAICTTESGKAAAEAKAEEIAEGGAPAPEIKIASNGFGKLFAAPPTRTALAGLLTANNVFMMKKISKEEKKAKERKKFLEELRDQVMASGNAFNCTSADRSNPGNLNCYCYGTDGKLNPSRNNSQVCSGLFQGNNLAGTSYSTGSGEAIPNFCTSNSGALDETCSCKSTNTCLTISGISGNLGANGINLGSIPSTLDAVNGGTLNGANLDGNALTAQAASLKNTATAIEAKNPLVAKANQKAKIQGDGMVAAASNRIGSSPLASSGGFDSLGDSMMQAKSPEEALAAIKQEIGRVETSTGGSVSGTRSSEEQLNFGLGGGTPSGGVTIDEGQLAAVMENSLANGNSDISSSNGNIFQILSNRYQRSGMRRLFGAESLPLEDANESDINK